MKSIDWKKPANGLFTVLLILILLSIPACLPSMDPTPPTLTPAPTEPTATVTIVWFPPTSTRTPQPTSQPSATPETLPGLGATIFSDDFSDPGQWTNASAASQGGNNILVSGNQLILAANNVPARLSSLRTGLILTDFFAQTTAVIHRCGEKDTYGLFFHAGSEAYAYRYVLTCAGQMRVDRIRGGESYPLTDWETSGDLPPGAPGNVKIGVWVAGVEMRFFLNDHYQFSVIDPMFKSGGLGYFASAESPVGLNISFSDLSVSGVSYVSPTPTSTPSKTPLPSRTPRPTP